MPSYETEIIKQFIENPQNTHRAVIANSVGMAILFLKKTYLKETYIEADIIEKYAHCIEAMKLVVKDNHKRQLGVRPSPFILARQPGYKRHYLQKTNTYCFAYPCHSFDLAGVERPRKIRARY
jgi:hypothetical protein